MEEKMEKTGRNDAPRRLNPGYIFGIFMIIVYLGMAYLLVFTPLFEQNFSPAFRYSIGIVFLRYGVYRQVKAYKK